MVNYKMKCLKDDFIRQCIGFNESYQSKKKKLKHIDVVYEKINTNEDVKLVFIGAFESVSSNYGPNENEDFWDFDVDECVFAITNTRLVWGCKTMFKEKFLSIPLERIKQVTCTGYYIEHDQCKFDTLDGAFTVEIENNNYINEIANKANTILLDYSYNYRPSNEGENNKTNISNNFERIKELKELLDIGAISQDEYDKIKNKLLDL